MVRFIPANHSLPTSERWQFGHSGNNQKMVVGVKPVAAHSMSYGSSNNLPSQFPVLCIDSERGHPLGIFQGDPLRNSFGLILLEMAIILVVSRVVRFLLKPLKQPKVVSDIIGGVFVGPSLLGHNKTFSSRVFPENTKFLVRNVGVMGFMYFLFISGVKMDLTLVKKSGRKHVAIAFLGVLAPILAVMGLAYIIRPDMDKELAKHSSIGAVASSVAIPAFPVLFPILKELNLLSSEVGRMALSTSIISDAIGLNAIVAFEAIKQGEADNKNAIWYVISTIVLALFMVTAVRKCMIWIIARTPEGKPVDQTYVAAILLGVLIIGFLTDMFGIAIGNGPLWLGLVIPDGPPLGSTLVDKTEMFIMEILMPFSFAYIGLYTDVYSMASIGWSGVAPLFYMVLLGYAFKFIATLLPSLFYNIPVRDSLTLSLIMSLRGQVEIFVFIHWMDKKIVGIPRFSLMILLTIAVTAVATPLIAVFYDPTRPYMVNKRRTIQHTPPNTEMGIILCIHDRESVNGLINLIEISYPTTTSKFDVYAIHLVELLGRAAPVFVDHNKEEEDDRQSNAHTTDDSIYSALKLYQEARAEFVNINTFTVQAPKRTMYQNICEMALLNKATIIIIPYHKEHLDDVTGTEIVRRGVQSVNSSVLAHAPCSVGVLVDKGELLQPIVGRRMRQLELNFVVLFLGGADAREALAYAERMVVNPDVTLTVVRFLSHNYDGDDEMEKKLDDGIVTSFWVKNEANERVIYREVVVKNGEETVAAIQALNDGTYDLWIMGRKQGINPILLEGLLNWSENIQELGVIGDIVAAASFGSNGSVLVIQQQILRGQGATGVDAAGAVDATEKSPCNFLSRFV